jgi:flagellar protein FliO/FliZ
MNPSRSAVPAPARVAQKRRHLLACMLLAQAATPAWAAEPAPGGAGMLQMLPGLGAVLVLIALLAWLARRMGMARPGGNSHLKVISERAVGTRERVVLVEVAGQWLVLGVAPGQVRALANLPRPAGLAADTPAATPVTPFAGWLERALKKS